MEVLKTIRNGIKARLGLNKISAEEQTALVKRQKENIETMSKSCEKVR